MDTLKKYFVKADCIPIFLLFILFLVTRMWGLTDLPIFIDEGVYIHIAKSITQRPELLWNPLAIEGKPIFHFWEMVPFMKVFPYDTIFAARLTSVFNGLLSSIGFFILCFYLWGKRAAFVGTLLFVTCPFFVLYDRLAMVDTAVNTAFIWVFFFSIWLIRSQNWFVAMSFGLVGGISLLIKSNTQLFLGLSAFAPLLLQFDSRFRSKTTRFIMQFLLVISISLVMFNLQRVSEYFPNMSKKNDNFVIPLSQLLQQPFVLIPQNLPRLVSFLIWETALLPLLIAAFGFVSLFKKNRRLSLYFLLWFMLPSIAFVFLLKHFQPRYMIFLASEVILLATYYISQQKNETVIKITLVLVLLINTVFNLQTLLSPTTLYFPYERQHLSLGLGAGWGIREIMENIRTEAKTKPVIVVTQGTFGLLGDMVESQLNLTDTNIRVDPYWPLTQKELEMYNAEIKTKTVYVVFTDKVSGEWPLELIETYPKPGNQAPPIHLYRFTGVMKDF